MSPLPRDTQGLFAAETGCRQGWLKAMLAGSAIKLNVRFQV